MFCRSRGQALIEAVFVDALTADNVLAVQGFIDDGVDVWEEILGLPPIMYAIHYGCLAVVQALVAAVEPNLRVVFVNQQGQFGVTLLMQAAMSGHEDIVEYLVGAGADVSVVDHHGINAAAYAHGNIHHDIILLLQEQMQA